MTDVIPTLDPPSLFTSWCALWHIGDFVLAVEAPRGQPLPTLASRRATVRTAALYFEKKGDDLADGACVRVDSDVEDGLWVGVFDPDGRMWSPLAAYYATQ